MQKYYVGDIVAIYITNRWLMGTIIEYNPTKDRPYLVRFFNTGDIWYGEDKIDKMKLLVKSYLRGKWQR